MTHNVTLIPGDWIGPESAESVKQIIAAAGVDINWDEHNVVNNTITEELLNSCRETRTILKARVASQREAGRLPSTIQLRKKLELWATVRPVKALAGVNAVFPKTNVVVIRETSEDIYSGFEHEVTDGVFEAVKITSRQACERISRYAFEYARKCGRRKITIVHKSNIMKKSDGMFLQIAKDISSEYPEIETEERIVDALCMQLVRWPESFDVLLTLNLFGDIVSDLCSGLAGGITASPSASYGNNIALFESLHGKAPDIVGTGKFNPIPLLNAAVMMLRHLNEEQPAKRIESAIQAAISKGVRTQDLGGVNSGHEMTQEIVSTLTSA
jgi:isocitrate dehydrogenase (NAD+)